MIAPGTDSIVGPGSVAGELLPLREGRSAVAVLAQSGAIRVAQRVASSLARDGLRVALREIPDAGAKRLETAARCWEWLGREGIGRNDTVVGVGGGSLTDLAGFVAATWLRGVEHVLVPTTLLAAVDAAHGGKTGLDIGGKNLVGVFHFPTRVVVDTEVLSALPRALIADGMAEALKAGLIGDAGLVEMIRENGLDAPLDLVVRRAVDVKERIVAEDPYESGLRMVLNYGHTIGHGIERAAGVSHGQAVGLGMIAAGAIAELVLGFDGEDVQTEALTRLGLPTMAPLVDRGAVMAELSNDKKRDATGLRMVLLEGLQRPVIQHVTADELNVGMAAIGL